MRILLLLIACFVSKIGAAQYLIANISLGNCASCYSSFALLNDTSVHLPKFAVFPEYMKEDSLEIERISQLGKSRFLLIFDDQIYAQTKAKNIGSTLNFFDINGTLIWQKDLRRMTKEFVKDSIQTIELIPSNHYGCRYLDSMEYCFDDELNLLRIFNRASKENKVIRKSDFPFDRLAAKLPPEQASKMNEFGTQFNQDNLNIASGYQNFQIGSDGRLYMMYEYIFVEDLQNIKLDFHLCMVSFDPQGEILDIIPIENSDSNRIFAQSFIVKDSVNFYAVAHPKHGGFAVQERAGIKDKKYLTHFAEEQGIFVAKDQLDFLLPEIYSHRFNNNFIARNISVYPYFTLCLANEVHDVARSESFKIIDDATAYQYYNSHFSEDHLLDSALVVTFIEADADHVWIYYRVNASNFLKIMHPSGSHTIDLTHFMRANDIYGVEIDAARKSLVFKQREPGYKFSIPMSVFD